MTSKKSDSDKLFFEKEGNYTDNTIDLEKIEAKIKKPFSTIAYLDPEIIKNLSEVVLVINTKLINTDRFKNDPVEATGIALSGVSLGMELSYDMLDEYDRYITEKISDLENKIQDIDSKRIAKYKPSEPDWHGNNMRDIENVNTFRMEGRIDRGEEDFSSNSYRIGKEFNKGWIYLLPEVQLETSKNIKKIIIICRELIKEEKHKEAMSYYVHISSAIMHIHQSDMLQISKRRLYGIKELRKDNLDDMILRGAEIAEYVYESGVTPGKHSKVDASAAYKRFRTNHKDLLPLTSKTLKGYLDACLEYIKQG